MPLWPLDVTEKTMCLVRRPAQPEISGPPSGQLNSSIQSCRRSRSQMFLEVGEKRSFWPFEEYWGRNPRRSRRRLAWADQPVVPTRTGRFAEMSWSDVFEQTRSRPPFVRKCWFTNLLVPGSEAKGEASISRGLARSSRQRLRWCLGPET